MQHTTNYNFNLPERSDKYNVENYNDNFKTIDTNLKSRVKTINNNAPDENGNVNVEVLDYVTYSEEFGSRVEIAIEGSNALFMLDDNGAVGMTGDEVTITTNNNGFYIDADNCTLSNSNNETITVDDLLDMKGDITALKTSKQDKLTAGENITIDNNVISASGGGSSHTYSTDEQVVGTWVDGKPIYEKTITGFRYDEYYSIDVTSWNIDTPIGLTGMVYDHSSYMYTQLNYANYYSNESMFMASFGADSSTRVVENIRFDGFSRNYRAYTIQYITVQYTKTTD